MIRPTATSYAGRVLLALVRDPGADVAALARAVEPPHRITRPFASASDRRAVLGQRRAHDEASRARVARALGRLVEAGFVERCQPARVDRWWREQIRRHGRVVGLHRALGHLASCGADAPPMPGLRRTLLAVEMRVGVNRNRDRSTARYVRQLVQAGILRSPSQRWPTVAGLEFAAEWSINERS